MFAHEFCSAEHSRSCWQFGSVIAFACRAQIRGILKGLLPKKLLLQEIKSTSIKETKVASAIYWRDAFQWGKP